MIEVADLSGIKYSFSPQAVSYIKQEVYTKSEDIKNKLVTFIKFTDGSGIITAVSYDKLKKQLSPKKSFF